MSYITTLYLRKIKVASSRIAEVRRLIARQRKSRNGHLAWIFDAVRLNSEGLLEFRKLVSECDSRPPRIPVGQSICEGTGKWDPFDCACFLCQAGCSGNLVEPGDGGPSHTWDFRRGRIRYSTFDPDRG